MADSLTISAMFGSDDRDKTHVFNELSPTLKRKKDKPKRKRKNSRNRGRVTALVEIARKINTHFSVELIYKPQPDETRVFDLSLSVEDRERGIDGSTKESIKLDYTPEEAFSALLEVTEDADLTRAKNFELVDAEHVYTTTPPEDYNPPVSTRSAHNRLCFELYHQLHDALCIMRIEISAKRVDEGVEFTVSKSELELRSRVTEKKITLKKGAQLLYSVARKSVTNAMLSSTGSEKQNKFNPPTSPKVRRAQREKAEAYKNPKLDGLVKSGTLNFIEEILESRLTIQLRSRLDPSAANLDLDFKLRDEVKRAAMEYKTNKDTIVLDFHVLGESEKTLKGLTFGDITQGSDLEIVETSGTYQPINSRKLPEIPMLLNRSETCKELTGKLFRIAHGALVTIQMEFELYPLENDEEEEEEEENDEDACTISVTTFKVWIQDYQALKA